MIFADIFYHYEVEGKDPPDPVFEIGRINNEVLNAVNHALSLKEVEIYLSEKIYEKTTIDKAIDRLIIICQRFHLIAKQLERRHLDRGKIRDTLRINDEYDTQDLLHALLTIDFEDVIREEVVPSFAGSSSRIDFLLKAEKIAVEVKYTSKTLKDEKIGEELLIDIAKYKNHPNCEYLLCFIYDPDRHLKNPEGLISDLSNYSSDQLKVRVVVNPL
ncbi:hypothetical protein JYQ62_02240 [Nostoc sp. UHCC 0702]|nr:hypothetical protein JYQ62_02240 [Nostoc sp. UHCC 0702]